MKLTAQEIEEEELEAALLNAPCTGRHDCLCATHRAANAAIARKIDQRAQSLADLDSTNQGAYQLKNSSYHTGGTTRNTPPLIVADDNMIERIRRNSRILISPVPGPGLQLYIEAVGRAHGEAKAQTLGKHFTDETAAIRSYNNAAQRSLNRQLIEALAKLEQLEGFRLADCQDGIFAPEAVAA